MPKFVPIALVAGLVAFALAGDAFAGTLTASTGPVKVNGKAATLPVELKKGDTVETGAASATFKSDSGDIVTLDRDTTAKSEGVEDGVEYLFVVSGVATGDISEKTTIGVSVGWATAAKGTRTEVRAEAPADRPGVEGRFRSIKGAGTWIRNGEISTWLPEANSVTLWRDRSKRGGMCFRTSQQNTARVDVTKMVAGGAIKVSVPRATSGCVEDVANNKTKISNEITSNKQDKIKIETEFGSKSAAEVGPGTYALIDNQTGGIELIDESVDDSIGEEIPTYDPVDDASDVSTLRKTKR